jgi:hypothetical protein
MLVPNALVGCRDARVGETVIVMRAPAVGLVLFSLAALAAGCSCGGGLQPRTRFDAGPVDAGPDTGIDTGHGCVGLQCRQDTCDGGGTTTLSGTVYTPAGDLPLYNVIVYVPQGPVRPFAQTLSCERCDAALSGSPLVQTTTDTHGRFTLTNVPSGADVPLVIQIGRWRRQVTVPSVASCTDTPLPAELTRLPRNQSEGDIPRIALTTGGADALECLLRKVGIDDSEFGTAGGSQRVHLYAGHNGADHYAGRLGGGMFGDAPTFWSSVDNLSQYDVVLLSCEGTENPTNKSPAALQAMQDYANAGGRVFASHWHNYWIEHGPAPWPSVANFHHQPDLADPFTATIDTSFPKGQALAEWLVNVGGSSTMGQVTIHAAQHTVDSVNTAQRWIYSDTPQSVQYFTFNTPFGIPDQMQCGRVVLSDIHVSSGDSSSTGTAFPNGCTSSGLTAQEKVLVFMLFDLSACIMRDAPI